MEIHIAKYPQLRALCWNRPDDAVVDGPEALGLYENNWRWIEEDQMSDEERALLADLVDRFGNGVFMPACSNG